MESYVTINSMTQKDGFVWDSDAQSAFEALKQAMTTTSVLSMPNFEIPLIIETDAYRLEIGQS